MKKDKIITAGLVAFVFVMLPAIGHSQTISGNVQSLHSVLENLYQEMIPLCSQLIGVARAVAGFAALWYIANRVWGHLARAEPVDVYPLLRPFALGMAILLFPQVLALINGLMVPLINATSNMVEGSNQAIIRHLEMQDAMNYGPLISAPAGTEDLNEYVHPESTGEMGLFERMANGIYAFNLKNILLQMLGDILQILFVAASLCINTIRTFQLIVLSILGPLVFGLSVFDGFQHTLPAWIARYIHVSMWLPVANIFGAIIARIQLNLLVTDVDFLSSIGYIVFMIIAIAGYFTVPNVASFIIQPGGRDSLLHKTGGMLQNTARVAAKTILKV